MSTTLQASIDELKESLQRLAEEIMHDPRIEEMRRLVATVNALEEFCKQPKTALATILKFGDQDQKSEGGGINIEPDEFVGLEPLDAAKRYLKKVGRAALFQDIVAAIKSGGCNPGNQDKLKVSLGRSAWDVVKVGEDRFGLLDFYPHMKRGGKKKKNGTPKEMDPDSDSGNGLPNALKELSPAGSTDPMEDDQEEDVFDGV